MERRWVKVFLSSVYVSKGARPLHSCQTAQTAPFLNSFPPNAVEFETRFATEAACQAYLQQVRWPQGWMALSPLRRRPRLERTARSVALRPVWV